MLTKRVIPCLDILNGRVVKGRKFIDIKDVGDPVEMASRYSRDGADELVLLDISATLEERQPFYGIVERVAKCVAIPLTVGGGLRTLEDILKMLRLGADKVSLNSVLTVNAGLLADAAPRVGSQALVTAIDVKRDGDGWSVFSKSGTSATRLDGLEFAKRVVALGAGELLITSIDQDGTQSGYDTRFLGRLAREVSVPVIASGGAGEVAHLVDALKSGADAVLAASIFHFGETTVSNLKSELRSRGVEVRL